MSNKARDSLKAALDELKLTREEVRVRLHLLSMEGRQTWGTLESKLRELDDQVRAEGEKAADASAAKVHEAAKKVRAFVERNLQRGDEARRHVGH